MITQEYRGVSYYIFSIPFTDKFFANICFKNYVFHSNGLQRREDVETMVMNMIDCYFIAAQ